VVTEEETTTFSFKFRWSMDIDGEEEMVAAEGLIVEGHYPICVAAAYLGHHKCAFLPRLPLIHYHS